MQGGEPHRGPLAGIRVIDLTSTVMGPYATQMMADMGADVIKVESPEGDVMRWVSVGPEEGLGGVFVNINRGKRAIVLDLRQQADKDILNRLIATADIFIHSMRARAIARLGLDYDAVRAIRPDIVYTNCYGYRRGGPYADKPAYDDTIQAECGLVATQRMINGDAEFVGTIMADKVAGLTALNATMTALFHRERTGEGQEIEIGMFETMTAFMMVEHANGTVFDPPLGKAHYPRVVSPHRRPYRTRDGHVAALIYNDKHWAAFVDAVQPEWAGPDLATLAQRAKQIDHVYARLAETFLERTTAEWLDLLGKLHVPAAPIRTPDELLNDPHLEAVGFYEEIDSSYGRLRFPGTPARFSASPASVAGPAPRLGEHQAEILAELDAGISAPQG
ncbi:CaiB/BaiF CoA transferase family protein [Sphingosinithalassobacter portus]|uniref:CaiB/BaiF CoA transferase family protein n=1 Tax=Stakelama portus TaxID=2676234 RepID=UPI000D6E661C|nr:CoA transferase [Sphingosinithalassobacter portus]